MVKHIPIATEGTRMRVFSSAAIETPKPFRHPADDIQRVYIVNIGVHDGKLELRYHKMLQEQCGLTDAIMHKQLEWAHNLLENEGFLFKGMHGEYDLAGIFLEIIDEEHYSFVASINLQLLSEQEGMEIANHFVSFFKTRRDKKLRLEGLAPTQSA